MQHATPSLHRQLLLWLLLPQLVLWLAAAVVTYDLAARYANQAIDASLYTLSKSLARQVKPIGSGLFIDFPRAAQDIIETDPDDRVSYMVSTPPGKFILGNSQVPPPPLEAGTALNQPYFYDAMTRDDQGRDVAIRVAALYLDYGEPGARERMLVQIARSRASREELTRRILVDTALPLSALIALMSLIVWAGIRAGLAPLARMRALVQDRQPNNLAPIKLTAAPQEVHALALAINALLGQVHESVSVQRRFVSDAAHQLRTPLAGLKSQTELALQEASDPALQERLRRVHSGATRSAHLVNQLLTLARAEPEAAAAQERSGVDLRRLAADVTAEWVPRARAAGVDLGLDAPDDTDATVDGNSLLLREALANLIDNAMVYAGRGCMVTVRLGLQGRSALLQVEDDGPGIAEADHARVLQRFTRASDVGNGCGLGLAIVQEIALRHGGSLALQAATPHGLIVTLRLPIN